MGQNVVREIRLSNGLYTLIDDEDYEFALLYNWHCFDGDTVSTQYAYCWNPYPNARLMHRMIMNTPIGMVTDHKDGNGLNNQRSNLRNVTYSQNSHNTRKPAKGCYYEFDRRKWHSTIMVENKRHFLGRFDSEEEAMIAYKIAKEKFFGSKHPDDVDAANPEATDWAKML